MDLGLKDKLAFVAAAFSYVMQTYDRRVSFTGHSAKGFQDLAINFRVAVFILNVESGANRVNDNQIRAMT